MQASFFDIDDQHIRLSSLGDPLEKMLRLVNFEMFREDLDIALAKEKKSEAGRKPHDRVMMFKILLLKRLYNLSDAQAEYQIN